MLRSIDTQKPEFAFSHLITCEHCGGSLVGERKKGNHVYCHCTGFKRKCGEVHVLEEVPEEVFEWVRKALCNRLSKNKNATQRSSATARGGSVAGTASPPCISTSSMARSTTPFLRRIYAQWRDEQLRREHEIGLIDTADRDYLESGVRLLELTQDAQRLFDQQGPEEKLDWRSQTARLVCMS